MDFAGGDPPEQAFLLPPDVREWLPERHLAWEWLGLAGRVDLTAFTGWYRADGVGRPAYHPKMMVALIGYCYCKGIRSSRGIEAATFDDLGARVICGNLHPDHSTTARFLARHDRAVRGLLAVSVAECAREGLVSVDVVAGDGTKVRASASMTANAALAGLNAQIAGLEELVAAEVDAWIAQARAEDALPLAGDDEAGPGGGGPGDRGRNRAAATLARRRQARDRLAAREAERLAAAEDERDEQITRQRNRIARARAKAAAAEAATAGRAAAYAARVAARTAAGAPGPGRGRAPLPAGQHRDVRAARASEAAATARLAQVLAVPASPGKPGTINTTDPSSQVMLAKNGGFAQAHNVQVLAGKRQVIYGILRHPSPVDKAALHPLLKAARATLDAAGIATPFGKVLFDAGYASDANFTAACQGDLHVAVTKEARQTGRLADGKQPATMKQSWQDMAAKLATDDGKAAYKQRSGIIEPVFAQLFARLGTHLNYRDSKADLELHLWAATHNMLKAIRARQHRAAPAPAS